MIFFNWRKKKCIFKNSPVDVDKALDLRLDNISILSEQVCHVTDQKENTHPKMCGRTLHVPSSSRTNSL